MLGPSIPWPDTTLCPRQVIFSVYHEKEKTWEKELRKIKAIYDNRLKASQQRALKMEQMLTMQTYQVRRRRHVR